MERILNQDIVGKVGEEVELAGWVHSRRDHGKLIFIDLRDRSGISQLVFIPQNFSKEEFKIAESLRSEWVIQIRGKVKQRPKGMENKDMGELGTYEIEVLEITSYNESKTPPFDITANGYEVSEEVRMKYRYLDLRRLRLQRNLRKRAAVVKFMRDFLTARDFVEVETPLLSKSTPEGARDYVVPSRVEPGKFYALPQSPQQYKQLLMVAGLERYFQIARALRDEDTRGDRQPEHTQLDIEISFTTPEEVMGIVEQMTVEMIQKFFPKKKMRVPWPKVDYKESMAKYGTDKPDIRENKDNLDELAFAWIVNFPSFEMGKESGRIEPVHHMFVEPQVNSLHLIDKEPLQMMSTQYDWVCNGYELASGSIRITDPALQLKVFKLLGMDEEKAKKDFGHILEAFTFGVPPHGGIAPGIDRLLMILQNEPNIREVIAFPKTGDGRDLLMGAPSELSKEQLKELHIKIDQK